LLWLPSRSEEEEVCFFSRGFLLENCFEKLHFFDEIFENCFEKLHVFDEIFLEERFKRESPPTRQHKIFYFLAVVCDYIIKELKLIEINS